MAFYSIGKNTYQVPMRMHAENRQKLISRLKSGNNPVVQGGVVLLQGGASETRDATDHEKLFRQESFFQYLFGVKEPDCFGTIDVHNNKTTLFIPKLPMEYAVWMGTIQPPSHFQKMYEVDSVRFVEELEQSLKEMNTQVIYTLKGQNSDSGNFHKEASFEGINNFKVDSEKLYPNLVECRVFKSEEELKLMRYVNKISSEAHMEVMRKTKPGLMEYQAEAVFLYETYHNGGCRNMSYTCICASGENGAILHYGHASAPNSKEFHDGDMVVFDMGAEYHCYGSDITRSYPVNGKFTEDQKIVYEAVLASQQAVMDSMKPGVSWVDMHKLSNRVICEELKKSGLLTGDIDEMQKNHIGALFMPHGLGHFLGIDTHDCGGYTPGTGRIQEPGIKSLRLGRKLEQGMVITVEPGIYFIASVLNPAFEDPNKKKFLNVDVIKRFMNFGGVRIEDDVIVTADGIENMTTAPRSVKEIEELMSKK